MRAGLELEGSRLESLRMLSAVGKSFFNSLFQASKVEAPYWFSSEAETVISGS